MRAQITALACTLPKESGESLSWWSATALAHTAVERGIVSHIAPSTIRTWLRAERIKPWRYHSWQQSTDPRFLAKATAVLTLYDSGSSSPVRVGVRTVSGGFRGRVNRGLRGGFAEGEYQPRHL